MIKVYLTNVNDVVGWCKSLSLPTPTYKRGAYHTTTVGGKPMVIFMV